MTLPTVEGINDVRKVSSGFEYSLLIFAPGSVPAFWLIVLDVEFNSASNSNVSEGGRRAKTGVLG